LRRDAGCRDWLHNFSVAGALLSAFCKVTHPELYRTSRLAFGAKRGDSIIEECLRSWSSVFSAVSVIVNQETPPHRDTGTLPDWYDILTTIGGDDVTLMDLPSLGIRLAYRSGTTTFFSSATIVHSVPAAKADRLCFAYYMKHKIHECFGVKAPSWMEQSVHRQTRN
jgi:hypothetical protein